MLSFFQHSFLSSFTYFQMFVKSCKSCKESLDALKTLFPLSPLFHYHLKSIRRVCPFLSLPLEAFMNCQPTNINTLFSASCAENHYPFLLLSARAICIQINSWTFLRSWPIESFNRQMLCFLIVVDCK